jgi:hypothetical protein
MKKAYSLLELSMVVIITGILIAGVIAGVGMIRAAKISNTRLFTSKSPAFEISGMIAWYEGSLKESFNGSEASEGSSLTAWYDLNPGSNSNVFGATKKNKLTSASSGTKFVGSGINSTPSVNFSGAANANFIISNSGSSTNFYQGTSLQNTIFLVIRPSAPSSTAQTILDSGSSGSPTASISIRDNAIILNAGNSISITTSFAAANDYVVATYFNTTASQVFVNNATLAAGSGDSGSNQLTGLTIGTDKSGASGFSGLISEIIVYNRPLKIQERKDVMNYLSKKYKISVSGL